MKSIIAVIPARYASTRFPGKPLIDIAGKTMIQRVYENVRKINLLHDVIVATDDERIFNHVRKFGKAMMTSASHQSGTERCAEVLSKLKIVPDIIINVQGDEPFVATEHLELIMQCFENSTTQIASLAKPVEQEAELFNPNIPKVVFDEKLQALYFSRSTIPFLRNVNQSEWMRHHVFYKHIGIYAYRSDALRQIVQLPPTPLEQAEKLEQLRWLENGYNIQLAITQKENIAIDTPQDLERLTQNFKP